MFKPMIETLENRIALSTDLVEMWAEWALYNSQSNGSSWAETMPNGDSAFQPYSDSGFSNDASGYAAGLVGSSFTGSASASDPNPGTTPVSAADPFK